MFGWARKAARWVGDGAGSYVDARTGGLTDFGDSDDKLTNYSPLAGLATDQHNSIASGIKEGATSAAGLIGNGLSSAWDVLSGERDYRRDRANFLENRDNTQNREDTSYVRLMEQLKQAGINPMLAGQLSPPGVGSHQPPTSHSGEGVRGALGLASQMFTSGISGITGLASAQASRASSAKSLADASSTLAQLPGQMAHTAAQTVAADASAIASQASAGLSRAHSAESEARIPVHRATAGKLVSETQLNKLREPQYQAEADFYRRYGRGAVLAREMKNPWQSAMLSANTVGQNMEAGGAINSLAANSARALNSGFERAVNRVNSGYDRAAGYVTSWARKHKLFQRR